MTILRKRPLTAVALGALFVGAISCGGGTTGGPGTQAVTPPAAAACSTYTVANCPSTCAVSACTAIPVVTPPVQQCTNSFILGTTAPAPIGTTAAVGVSGCANTYSVTIADSDIPSSTITGATGAGSSNVMEVYGTAPTSGALPSTITNVDTVDFESTLVDASYNLLGFYSMTVNGVATYKFDDLSLLGARTITTGAGQSLNIATAAGLAKAAGLLTWTPTTGTDTALNLIFNGYQGASTGPTAMFVTSTSTVATTLNIASTGSYANAIGSPFTGPTTVTKHVITGNQKFTYALAAADVAALASIDASASTGGAFIDAGLTNAALPNSAFKFTGGAGNDTLVLEAGAIAALGAGTQITMGSGTNDKLSTSDATVNAVAAWYTKLSNMTGVESLGLKGTIAVDASQIITNPIARFSVDTAGLTQSVTQIPANGIIDIGPDTAGAFAATSLALTPASGVSALTMNFGLSTSTAAHSLATATLTGFTAIAVNSNGVGPNLIGNTALHNSDNSVFTVKGNAATTFGTLAATAIGNKIDGSAMTGALIAVGNTTAFSQGSSLGDTLIGGSASDTLTASKNYGTLTGGAGTDTFDTTLSLGGVAATVTKVTNITDPAHGETLNLLTAGTATFTATENATCKAATTLAAVLNALAAGDGSTNNATAWCTATAFDGNTYVVTDLGAGATFAVTDIGTRLPGAFSLVNSVFVDAGATGTLVF